MNTKCLGCGKVIAIQEGKTTYKCICRTVNNLQAMKDVRKLREFSKLGKKVMKYA
jgi:hypothetical protein